MPYAVWAIFLDQTLLTFIKKAAFSVRKHIGIFFLSVALTTVRPYPARAVDVTVNSTGTTAFVSDVTGNLNFAADGTATFTANEKIIGSVTTDTNNTGTLTFSSNTVDTALVSGTVGSSGKALKEVNISPILSRTATFGGAYNVATTNHSGSGAVTFSNTLTGDVNISNDGTVNVENTVTGNIDNTSGISGKGTITFGAGVDYSGSIGTSQLLKTININTGASLTSTMTGTPRAITNSSSAIPVNNSGVQTKIDFRANDINLNGTGTTEFVNTNVVGNLNFLGDGSATFTANKGIFGSVTSNANNTGSLTFAPTTTNTTLVSGNISAATSGAITKVNVAPVSGVTAKFSNSTGASYNVATTAHSGKGKVSFLGDVKGNINVSDGGEVFIDRSITGNIDNTGAAGSGVVTFDFGADLTGDVGATNPFAEVKINSNGNIIKGAVSATTIILGGTSGTTDFEGSKITGRLNFERDATAKFSANQKIIGSVTTNVNNTGTLTFGNSTTDTTLVNGPVGSSGALLKKVTAGAVSGKTASFASDVFATTVSLSNSASGAVSFGGNIQASTLEFLADSTAIIADNKNLTANVTTATFNTGTLTFNGTSTVTGDVGTGSGLLTALNINGSGGVVTLSGDLHAVTTTVGNLATLKFTKAATTVSGALTAPGSGTIDVGASVVSASGAITFGANSTFKVGVGRNNGQLDASTSGVTFASGTSVTPVANGFLRPGIPIVILKDNDGNIGSTGTIVDNSARYDFTLALNGNNLELTPTKVSLSLAGSSATAINDIAETAFSADTELLGQLNSLPTASDLGKALETLAPVVSGGAVTGAVSAGGASSSAVSTRVASLRTGISAGQGLSAGDEVDGSKSYWFQGFGTFANQKKRQGVEGFESVTGGFAFGSDKPVTDRYTFGLAGSYSYTNIDSENSENRTFVKSYQATLYGSYKFDNGYYLEAQTGLALNIFNSRRFISIGALTREARSKFDGYQFLQTAELGRDISFGNNFEFTPSLGLSWAHIEIDNYTESNAGASNLVVGRQKYDIFNITLKGEARRTWLFKAGSLSPEIHLGYNYEAIHDQIQTVSSFSGGGSSFQTTGFKPANHTGLVGSGITWSSDNNFDFVFTYDLQFKEDFTSHSALLKGRWKF